MIEARSKISSKGQVVIPADIRSALKLEEGDDVKFIINDEGDLKLDVIRKSSIHDLYGSLKPIKSDLRDFSEIREEARHIKREEYRNKGD
jgi:antitoxin PrlF